MAYCPVGFAHGFCVVSDVADVMYKQSNYYADATERGIAYNDPDVAIEWPLPLEELSRRSATRRAPLLRDIEADLPFVHAALSAPLTTGQRRGRSASSVPPETLGSAMESTISSRPAETPSTGMRRVDWLDGMRGAAAMFVVLHHTWLSAWPAFPRDTGPAWLGWLLYGHLAVAVFIVVSGFSLSLAPVNRGDTLSGGTRRFIRRRAWRIIPPYWAALILSTIVSWLILQPSLSDTTVAKGFVGPRPAVAGHRGQLHPQRDVLVDRR